MNQINIINNDNTILSTTQTNINIIALTYVIQYINPTLY